MSDAEFLTDDEHFHDLRKRCKRELYQRELLEAVMDASGSRRLISASCLRSFRVQVFRRLPLAAGRWLLAIDSLLPARSKKPVAIIAVL